MRSSPRALILLRRALDRRLGQLGAFAGFIPPATGWMRSTREALGLTAEQLARRLGVSTATVLNTEKREPQGKIKLETLQRAAHAMGCRVVYAIVPEDAESFEAMVDAQSLKAASRLMARAGHSMALEAQRAHPDDTDAQVRELARRLKDEMRSMMWDDDEV